MKLGVDQDLELAVVCDVRAAVNGFVLFEFLYVGAT